MAKDIAFHENARKKIKKGIDKAVKSVAVTIGPRGRNVALEKSYGGPTITNDGVSIAKEISFKDPFENMGAEMVKEVASKTNDLAGDGTTTSVILFDALVSEGMKYTTLGVDAMSVRRGMENAMKDVIAKLKENAREIKGQEEIEQVATVSAESEEIGKIIAETIQKVGKDGVVTVEESQSFGIEYDVVEGMEFDRGYVSPYMITNPERMEAEYKDVAILITDKKISGIKEILPFLEKVVQGGTKDIVIMADEIEGEALTTFVLNRLRGTFNVLAIKAPGYGDRKKEMLSDIATVVGATVISDETGHTFENADQSVLGRASRVISKKEKTVIVGGKEQESAIEERVKQIKTQREQATSTYERDKFDERIAKLTGGVAVIKVGAATETEMKYLKLKIEDAVNATKAAIEEGIVPGGGSALAHIASTLKPDSKVENIGEKSGYGIVIGALSSPLKQIVSNVGKEGDEDGSVVASKIQDGKETSGYDANNDKIVDDMIKAGIIDPVKVTRSALQHAVSTASLFLTTETAIVDIPEDKKDGPQAPGGMGGMGGMGF